MQEGSDNWENVSHWIENNIITLCEKFILWVLLEQFIYYVIKIKGMPLEEKHKVILNSVVSCSANG
jgi:hypothetical protein